MPILSPSPVFRWFVPAQSGSGLVPAAGYKAKWYSAGTSNAKAIYDADGTIYPSPSNTAILNSEGYAEIKLGDGSYKLVVTDSLDNVVYTQDNIQGGGGFSTGIVSTVDGDLPDVDPAQYPFVYCMGYWEVGDGGHGFFWNAVSSASVDGGYTIASNVDGTKRWFRVSDESGDVRAASFGYVGTRAENLTTQLQNAAAYCVASGKNLIIGPGSSATVGVSGNQFSLYTWSVHFGGGAVLTAASGVTSLVMQIANKITGTSEPHFSGFPAYSFATSLLTLMDPTWFGAALASDNTTPFASWLGAGGGAFVLPPGNWTYTDPASFPYPTKPLILLGSIGSGGSKIPTGAYFPDDSRLRIGTVLFPQGNYITDGEAGIDLQGHTNVAGNLQVSGQANVTNSIITLGGVVARTGISASVAAGIEGYFDFLAGLSASVVKVGGTLYVYADATGAASTTNGADNILATIPIAANAIAYAGDRLRVRASGTMVMAANVDRTFKIKLGTSTMITMTLPWASITASTYASKWTIDAEIVFITASSSVCDSKVLTNYVPTSGIAGPGPSMMDSAVITHGSNPWTSAQNLYITGNPVTSGSITLNKATVEYYPKP